MLLSTLNPNSVTVLRLMAEVSQTKMKPSSPSGGIDVTGEYKVEYPHKVYTGGNAIALSLMQEVDKLVTGKWGWNFEPHHNMDYNRQNWFERQNAYMSFEHQYDAVQVSLSLKLEVN